jgi:hypothetical protein
MLALFALVALVIWRVTKGPPTPEGFLVMSDLDVGRLHHEVLELTAPATLAVEAAGSLEDADNPTVMAAYGWVLRRSDRQVVWQMDPAHAERDGGTLFKLHDTLRLEPGTYDVFFTTFGSTLDSRDHNELAGWFTGHWVQDENKWHLVMRLEGTEGQGIAQVVEHQEDAALAPHPQGRIWTSAPMGDHASAGYLFAVEQPLSVQVYALGEQCSEPCDYGWIEEVGTGRKVWTMTLENTTPAGGRAENRMFKGTVELAPGLYRAFFETDATHDWDIWRANPPLDPAAWGLTLSAATPAAAAHVRAYDPWANGAPLVQITRIRDDETRAVQVHIPHPTRTVVYATGEVGDQLYDYGWIENNDTGEKVWEMSKEKSMPAGGYDGNRAEIAFLELQPGTYTVHYQSDGSHSFEDWSNGTPDHPERWGITLFPFAGDAGPGMVEIMRVEGMPEMPFMPEDLQIPVPPLPPGVPPGAGTPIVNLTRLGKEEHIQRAVRLEHPTRLHIRALGEISSSGRYDYGWIERREDGTVVWEMNLENTRFGGGDDRNRLFDGIVPLPPGEYFVHFKTDFGHNFEDFEPDEAPSQPDWWGIYIEKLDH